MVAQDGTGDFRTVSEAAAALPPDAGTCVIRIRNGVYREKLSVRAERLLLIGEDRGRTILTWQDGARSPGPSGGSLGTFRSYTAYLGGGKVGVKNLTIRNTAGDGAVAGQAVAVYADAAFARFENVTMESQQDTLFLAPLPDAPRTPGSFVGPGDGKPRRACVDYLKDCMISGDVDFVFGGAEAVFSHCTLVSRNRGGPVNGYITAASTPRGQRFGFLLERCALVSDCPARTVFLGRPWREHAQVSFLECRMGEHIAGWSLWTPGAGEESTVRFSESGCTGPGARGERPPWVRALAQGQADELRREAARVERICRV